MKNLFILSLTVIACFLNAQTVQWGPEIESKVAEENFVFEAETENKIFAIRSVLNNFYVHAEGPVTVEIINKTSLTVEKVKPLPLSGGSTFAALKTANGKLFLFSSSRSDQLKKLFVQQLDEDLNEVGPRVFIGELKDKVPAFANAAETFTLVEESFDKKSFNCLMTSHSDGSVHILCADVSVELNISAKQEFLLPVGTRANVNAFKADNQGNYYALLKIYIKYNHQEYLVKLNIHNSLLDLTPYLETGDVTSDAVIARYDTMGNVVMSGLYCREKNIKQTETQEFKKYSGYFVFWSGKKDATVELRQFAESYIKGIPMFNLRVRNFFINNVGDAHLVFEQVGLPFPSDEYSRKTFAEFNNIGIIKFNKNATLWSLTIHKRQSPKSGYRWRQASYEAFLNEKGGVGLIFNDHPANTDANTNEPVKCNWKELETFYIEVAANGKMTKTSLIKCSENSTLVFSPAYKTRQAGQDLFLYLGGKSKFKIGRIE